MRSKKYFINVLTSLLLEIVVLINGFIIPRLIIGKFGSNVNGLVSSIVNFLGYITLLESGFGPVVKATLYKPIANKDKDSIKRILKSAENFFRMIAIIFLFYIVVLALIYPKVINKEFSFIFTFSLVLIISISTFAEYFFGMTYKLYLQAEQNTYIISFIQIGTYIFSIISIVICINSGASIHVVKLVSGLIFILRPLLQNFYVKKKYKINLKNVKEKYVIENKWDGLAQHIAYVIHTNTDVTVLTIFSNLAEVSVYSVYHLVVNGIKKVISIFSSSVSATFGDMIAKDEKENLNKKFNIYGTIYYTIVTIVFACAMILIVPFVRIYVHNVKDVNYERYSFGYLLTISEYVYMICLPYRTLIFSAGKFKEIRRGSWIEAILNIIISILLVNKFGIVGVAIGTIIAMSYRAVELIYFANKNILECRNSRIIKRVVLIIIETVLINIICYFANIGYSGTIINWVINALITFSISSILVFVINLVIYKKEFQEAFQTIFSIFKKRKKNEAV